MSRYAFDRITAVYGAAAAAVLAHLIFRRIGREHHATGWNAQRPKKAEPDGVRVTDVADLQHSDPFVAPAAAHGLPPCPSPPQQFFFDPSRLCLVRPALVSPFRLLLL